MCKMPRKERLLNVLPITLILTFYLVPPLPEGRVAWTPGFPMPIPGTGSAVVSGRFRPESGGTPVSATVHYFENGCQARTRILAVDKNGIVGPAVISGLTPGKRYEVIIRVMQNRDGQNDTFANMSWVIAR
jgi:hypothetical protein